MSLLKREALLQLPVRELIHQLAKSHRFVRKVNTNNLIVGLNKKRIKHYVSSGDINIQILQNFLQGNLDDNANVIDIIVDKLRQPELSMYLYHRLKSLDMPVLFLKGYNKFDIDKSSPEVEMDFTENYEFFYKHTLDNTKRKYLFEKGYHVFLVNADKELSKDIVKRVANARQKHKNVHVFVPEDTEISEKVVKKVAQAGGDIVLAPIKREGVENSVLNLKTYYEKAANSKAYDGDIDTAENSFFEKASLTTDELVSQQLGLDKTSEELFKRVVGEQRIRQYALGGFDLKEFDDFLNRRYNVVISEIMGREFNVYYFEELKGKSAENINFEVINNRTQIDAKCDLLGDELFVRAVNSKNDILVQLGPGTHVFELKAKANISTEDIEQIGRIKSEFENVHLVVLEETFIHTAIIEELDRMGVYVLRAEATKESIRKRLISIREEYENEKAKPLENESNAVETNLEEHSSSLDIEDVYADLDTAQKHELIMTNMLEDMRLEQFNKYNVEPKNIVGLLQDFKYSKLKSSQIKVLRNKALEIEMNMCLIEELEKMKSLEIKLEVGECFDHENINISAVLPETDYEFRKVLSDLREVNVTLEKDEHLFITNFKKGINDNVIELVKKGSENHKNVHVIVLIDSIIDSPNAKRIYENGGDILLINETQKSIKKRVNGLQTEFTKVSMTPDIYNYGVKK